MGTSDGTVKFRIDPAELASWRVAAEQRSQSLSNLIRSAVRASLALEATPIERDMSSEVTTGGAADMTPRLARARAHGGNVSSASPTRPCAKSSLHRPGVRCGYCGATP